jgi:hypothetical protein
MQEPRVLRSQRREWKVERAGWLVMGMLLAAGLAGLFGGGPLAHASVSSGPATLEFDRLVRHSVLTRLRLTVGTDQVSNGRVLVSLDWKYLDAVNLRDVTPEPVATLSSPERVAWEFDADPAGNTIVFEVEPRQSGTQEGHVKVGGTELTFTQFVYP